MNTTLDTTTTPTRSGGLRRRCQLALAALGVVATGFLGSTAASAASTPVPVRAPAPAVATASLSVCIQAPFRTSYGTYWGAYGSYPVQLDLSLGGQTASLTFRTTPNGCVTAYVPINGTAFRFRVYARLGACTYVGQTGWTRPYRAVNYSYGTVRISAVC